MANLVIVIPVYNESEIIETVIKDWYDTLAFLKIDSYVIKVYNDGSTDETLSKLRLLERNYNGIVEVVDKPNSGHGPTILKGYKDSTDCDWIFQVDSDNEIPARYFEKFWELRNDYDLILGNRTKRGASFFRSLMTLIAKITIFILYGGGIKDVNIPYRLMRQSMFKDYFNEIPSKTFTPNIILSGIATRDKLRMLTLNVESQYRTTGESTLNKNIPKLVRICIVCIKEIIAFSLKKI